MNIFFLDRDPAIAATYHVNAHVGQMRRESAQLLFTGLHVLYGAPSKKSPDYMDYVRAKFKDCPRVLTANPRDEGYRDGLLHVHYATPPPGAKVGDPMPYLRTHTNHPSAKWVRQSRAHAQWTHDLLHELCNEHAFRHRTDFQVMEVLSDFLATRIDDFPDTPWVDPPSVVGADQELTGDVVEDYREYYRVGKRKLWKWKKRAVPSWMFQTQPTS